MSHDALILILGWVGLTYSWFYVNLTFIDAIAQAVDNFSEARWQEERQRKEAIRQEILQKLKHKNEDEDEDEV